VGFRALPFAAHPTAALQNACRLPLPFPQQTRQGRSGLSTSLPPSIALLRVLLGDHTALLLFMGTAMQQVLAMEAATQAALLASLSSLPDEICGSPVRLALCCMPRVAPGARLLVALRLAISPPGEQLMPTCQPVSLHTPS
jgi:hypothetical protein